MNRSFTNRAPDPRGSFQLQPQWLILHLKAKLPDIVLYGTASSDSGSELVGLDLATFVNFPVVTMVREMTETGGQSWIVKADFDNVYRNVPA